MEQKDLEGPARSDYTAVVCFTHCSQFPSNFITDLDFLWYSKLSDTKVSIFRSIICFLSKASKQHCCIIPFHMLVKPVENSPWVILKMICADTDCGLKSWTLNGCKFLFLPTLKSNFLFPLNSISSRSLHWCHNFQSDPEKPHQQDRDLQSEDNCTETVLC